MNRLKGWKVVLALVLLALALSGCFPDPRKQAEAEAVRVKTETQRLDAAQKREFESKVNDLQLADGRRTDAVKNAALEDAKMVARGMTWLAGIALTFTLCLTMISIGLAARSAILGAGKAAARAAMVKANLIYLDPRTGNYPALLEYVGAGRYSLTDLNTRTTLLLDTHNDPDREMVRGAMAVRHVGVISANAAKSRDAEGVASIQPLILDAEVNNEVR